MHKQTVEHGVVKRAIEWSEAGAARHPGNRVYDGFLDLYISTLKRATNIERISAERYNLIVSESPETKIIDLQ